MVRIIHFDDAYRKAWDIFVDQHAQGHIFFRINWKDIIERAYRLRPVYVLAVNETNQIEGVVPLFFMRNVLGKRYFVSLPFCNYAGILADNDEVHSALVTYLEKLAIAYDVEYIELRYRGRENTNQLPSRDSFVTLIVDLRRGSDELFRSLSARNREKIRQAERLPLNFSHSVEYLDEFYDIFARNMRRLGTPVYPKSFFRNIVECFRDETNILMLQCDSKVVAAMFTIRYKNCLYELWVSSLAEYNKMYVNNFLCWKAFQYAADLRLEYFDFGRSTRGSGTHDFKKQWEASTVPLAYQYIFHKAREVPRVDAHRNKYQPIIEVWKKIPLLITNRLGPRLVRYLPEL